MLRRGLIIVIVVASSISIRAQHYSGVIIDARTEKPLPDCYVILKGNFSQAISGSEGRFVLSIPATLEHPRVVFSAPGYSILERSPRFEITDTVRLLPTEINLSEVEIKAERKKLLNQPMENILDFDLMHGYIVTLTGGHGKNLLKVSTAEGREVARASADKKSETIAVDCLGNLQLFGPDSVWQLYFDFEQLYVMKGVPRAQFDQVLGNCVLRADENYYFCSRKCRNLVAEYYFFNATQRGVRQPLVALADSDKVRMYERDYDLQYFLKMWKNQERPSVTEIEAHIGELREAVPLPWTYRQALGELNTQLLPSENGLYLVNFNDSTLRAIGRDHHFEKPVRLTALRNKDIEKAVVTDKQTKKHYLLQFSRSTLSAFRINPSTGAVESRDIVGTVTFMPKKVVIYGNRLYYLHANHADTEHPVQLVRYLLHS